MNTPLAAFPQSINPEAEESCGVPRITLEMQDQDFFG